ncbi:MAG: OmpA family protein [Pseudomonadota bacterium]
MTRLMTTTALAAALTLGACSNMNNTARGAVGGAVVGAGLGTLAGGNDARNAAIGAAVGAIAGAGVGAYMDRQEKKLREQTAGTGVEVTREGDQLELRLPSDVTFASGESNIQPQFFPVLDDVSATLLEFPSTAVDIIGHADSQGSEAFNQALSERRAQSVQGYLISKGVQGERLLSYGRGEMDPIASNETPEGRAQNRRVQILLTPIVEEGA